MSDNPYTSPDKAHHPPRLNTAGNFWMTVLALLGGGALLFIFYVPYCVYPRAVVHRHQCADNLKQIAVALYNYHDVYGALPPAYTVDVDGKPLHSWRTLILPFINEHELAKKIDLSKPWNHPANAEALQTVVSAYDCPADDCPGNHTTYLAIVAPNGCFQPTEPRRMSEIADGVSQTLLVIEVPSDQSVPWMSPQDAGEELLLSVSPHSQLAHDGGMMAAYVDSRVEFLPADLPADQWRARITIAGDDFIDEYD